MTAYLVLTDENGATTSVLEGSDLISCADKCSVFHPKPGAVLFDRTTQSADVQQKFYTGAGNQTIIKNGFDGYGGFYQYILMRQGLGKLSNAVK